MLINLQPVCCVRYPAALRHARISFFLKISYLTVWGDRVSKEAEALETVESLLERFYKNIEADQLTSFSAYEEDILDKTLPDEDQIEQYDFQMHWAAGLLIGIIVYLIPSLILIRIVRVETAEWSINMFLLLLILALLAAFILYRISVSIIKKMTDYKRRIQQDKYWSDVRKKCRENVEDIERLQNMNASEEKLENKASIGSVILSGAEDGLNGLYVVKGTDETGKKYLFHASVKLGEYVRGMETKGWTCVLKGDKAYVSNLSLTQIKTGNYNMIFSDSDGATEKLPEKVLRNIFHRAGLSYMLSKKEAFSILTGNKI